MAIYSRAMPGTFTTTIFLFYSEPAKMPVANNRGVSSKPKASPSPHQPTTKKKQEQSNGNKSKSNNSTKNKNKEPSDAPKYSPKTVANKTAKSPSTKASPKKALDPVSTQKKKSGMGNQQESTPKRRNGATSPNATQNSTPIKTKTDTASYSSPKTSTNISPMKGTPKRKRMTKQEKLEKEKKAEERSKIFDDWSEEEDEELEEIKQIKELIKSKIGDESDSGSDDDRDPAFLDDDNIHGYDDDDEEILPPEPVQSKKSIGTESNIKTSGNTELKEGVKKTPDKQKKSLKDDSTLDIDKMLEETEVPKISIDAASNNSPKKPKRGVKFSSEISKDIAIKKIQLVQTSSNLADPMDVDDEFAFSEEPELAVAKPILKRPNRPPPKIIQEPVNADEDDYRLDSEQHSSIQKDSTTQNISSKPIDVKESTISKASVTTEKANVISTKYETNQNSNANSCISSTTTSCDAYSSPQQTNNTHGSNKDGATLQQASQEQQMIASSNENVGAVAGSGQGNSEQEETYMILVDDNSDHVIDSLNSQLLYLDSNSLANGNVVLMTQDSVNAATLQGNGHPQTAENNSVANGGTAMSMPTVGGIQSLERQVVTTVDTKGGVATIPGQIQHSSAASQIQLITSPAQAPGPLVSATANSTSIQSTE